MAAPRILFICHGNICRSTMAEFVFTHMARQAGFEVEVASKATSTEELGNPVHHGTRRILTQKGIPMWEHYAEQMSRADYDRYDLLIGMDGRNLQNMLRICGGDPEGKIHLLLDYAGGGDIADPWYTGDFEPTYRDVTAGCTGLLQKLMKARKENDL
ncbi:MAG: low molecular weight phosphotyrosine protein phosphatase [Clostridia bacterium]|nr:low molecular weight phosphotyrosine protein phosphatase [Clostridia bacterium]